MKKILTIVVLISGIFFAENAGAQLKIGYINIDEMVRLMPETTKIDTLVEIYLKDSLDREYESMISRYRFYDSVVYRGHHGQMAPAQSKETEKELKDLLLRIQNWQKIVQDAYESMRNKMLAPVYRKVYDAVKAVAKEKGYTHVLTKEALLVAPEADDLLLLVATKLNVKLAVQTGK